MSQENWKAVLEFPNYEVSNKGGVRNRKRKIYLGINGNGFPEKKFFFSEENG
jgi:NUMOD4 motif